MAESGIQQDGSFVPEFPGQRPPHEPGNTLAVKHGAYAKKALEPAAQAEADVLRELWPVLAAPRYEAVVELLAITRVQTRLAHEALQSAKRTDRLRLSEDVRGWIRLEKELLGSVGLTPQSEARLGLTLAQTKDELERHLAANYSGAASKTATPIDVADHDEREGS